METYKYRRLIAVTALLIVFCLAIVYNSPTQPQTSTNKPVKTNLISASASQTLAKLIVKGRAPKTGYTREQFGADWTSTNGCDTRNIILNRDLREVKLNDICQVVSGVLNNPYSGDIIQFVRGTNTSSAVQIDHVVALSDAWQKGAQSWTKTERITLANDPLELLAVGSAENQNKGDGDAATWLPPNKSFRCEYVARQIAVKYKYSLWVTLAEHDAIATVLSNCPTQLLPSP